MSSQLSSPCPPADPLQSVLQTLEKQHQEEKRCALERQRQMYEQELQQLRQRVTPEKPSGVPGSATAAVLSAGSNKRVRRWSEDRWRCSLSDRSPKKKSRSLCTAWLTVIVSLCYREAMITRSLRRLKEQIVRARLLAQEAGFIAEELNKRTEYLVTLQIPAANLDANRKVQQGDVCFKTNVVPVKEKVTIKASQFSRSNI